MGFMGYIFDTTPKFLPSLLVSQKQSSTILETLQNILTHKRKKKNTIFKLIKTMGSNSRTLKETRITNSQLSYTKICQKLYWNLKKRVFFFFFFYIVIVRNYMINGLINVIFFFLEGNFSSYSISIKWCMGNESKIGKTKIKWN